MSTTTNLQIELLEVGGLQKDPTINTAFTKIDAAMPICLADSATDPATTGKAPGTTYYNTTAKVMKILLKSGVWSVVNGYLGEFAADPATTNLQSGSTYFNTASTKLKVLKSDGSWAFVHVGVTYLGELSADPSASGIQAGSTYFNTVASKLKVLKSDTTWVNVA